MFIQVQRADQEEGNIIVHGHIDHAVQSDNLQRLLVLVIGMV